MPNLTVHESAEDYLETILILQSRNGLVRSIDIVNEMNFSKPSISIAMKKLREQDYIEMDQNGYISLKPEGRKIAERIYARHKLLTKCLMAIGIDVNAGHGHGKPMSKVIDEYTDIQSFIMYNLGVKP